MFFLKMFVKAMNQNIITTKGAISLSTPDKSGFSEGRLSLFFKAVRGLDDNKLNEYVKKASEENVIDAFLLAFNIRDCRGGKGERDIGRKCLKFLFLNYPEEFMDIINLIPEYGRWDDLLEFFPNVLNIIPDIITDNFEININNNVKHTLCIYNQNIIVKLFGETIKKDKKLMLEGKPCSIACKWAPTENDSIDTIYKVYKTLADSMGISCKELRKHYLTPLRTYINVVEHYMCAKEWDKIDYSKVPSCAMLKLKKAFEKNDEDRFKEWSEKLYSGENKICGKQLFPHELVKEMRKTNKADEVCEAQWKTIKELILKNGTLSKSIVICDTSSSMIDPNYIPIDVCIAMGLIISECTIGEFHNNVITFNDIPQFIEIKDGPLYERYIQIKNIPWGGSTYLDKTFEMILEKAKQAKLQQEDMPEKIWLISDMQFNNIDQKITNFEYISELYKKSGYKRPNLIFWNVNGSSNDFPVSVDDNGTCLISGFSTYIMKSILENSEELNCYNILRKTLDSERLKQVKDALENS